MITGSINIGRGRPLATGVYAVRVDDPDMPGMHKDLLLMWFQGKWSYPRSDQFYRGTVHQFVGPLPRRIVQ